MNNHSRSSVTRISLLAGSLLFLAFAVQAVEESDLLVAYDNSYADSIGGDDNVEVVAANGVAGSNLINKRSGTPARIRIAGFHKTWWQSGRSTLGGYVNWMANYGDGNLDEVTTEADARGADLVTFICRPTSGETAGAVAQQPGRYSSFGPGNFWSTTVAHEIGGHNFGCDHRIGHEASPKTVMLHNYCGGGAQGWLSNPNIWLWGENLRGTGSCLGAAVDSGDAAAKIASTAPGRAEAYSRPNTGPKLDRIVRRWRFDAPTGSAPSGTTFIDEVSGSSLATVLGSGAMFTGDGLRLPGGGGASGAAYIELPSGLVSGYTNVTIEIWATPLSARSWARLIDINSASTANYFILTATKGTDLNSQRFESNIGGSTASLDSGLPTAAGVPHHYTITFADNGSGGGRWQWYRDGDPVACLDVTNYTLATMPDSKTWLGRSAWSADDFANCDYMEVRVSDVTMTDDQVLANYQLGIGWDDESTVRLTADDALGTSSFNSSLHWRDGLAPSGAKDYETFNFKLRTPATSSSYAFSGNSLKMTGGTLLYKGTGGTITVNELILDGRSTLFHASSGIWTLAGNMTVNAEEAKVRGKDGPLNITANMGGEGSMLYVDGNTTLSGNNAAFTGKTCVGDGRSGMLTIDSEARLGGNPASFVADQLTLDRGTLRTTASMMLDDVNRGITMGVNGGVFDVASGTTLTLASPLSCTPSDAVVGLITKGGSGTLVLASTNSTFNGTLYVDTGSATSDNGKVRVANNQVIASALSPIYIRNNNSGTSTLELDGTTENIGLAQGIYLSGRNASVAAIRNLDGDNVIAGGITADFGGTYYGIQSDAGTLQLGGLLSSAATGATRTWTFQGSGDTKVSGVIQNGSATTVNLTKTGSGRLLLESANSYSGITTISEGELVVNGSTGAGNTTLSGNSTLSGGGTVKASLTANAGSKVRVGTQGFPLGPDTSFPLIDDFQGYPFGANGTALAPAWVPGFPSGGVGSGSSTSVGADTGAGQALHYVHGGSGGQINYSSIGTIAAEGATGTIFFQAYLTGTGSDTLFALGRSGAAAYGDLAALFRVPSDRIVEVHNGGYVDTSTTLSLNTLYNFWVVINNAANTSSLYYSPGGPGQTPVLIRSGFAFRSTTAGDINTFYLGSNSGSAGFIDNIYVDPTGANLTNPLVEVEMVPKAATLNVATNFTLASNATLEFDVSSPALHDRLVVGGQFNASGTLKVTLDPEQPAPSTGDTFDLFVAAGGTVSFAAFDLPDLAEGLSWDTGAIASGVLSVVGTPSGFAGYMNDYGIPGALFEDDANSNGVPNGMEYYIGWNPTNPVTTNRVLSFSSDYLSVFHPFNPSASGVTGSVEWTTDLLSSNWYSTGVSYATNMFPDEIEATWGNSTTNQLFIRLKVDH